MAIKVYFSSSMVEFAQERIDVAAFVGKIDDAYFAASRDVVIKLVLAEFMNRVQGRDALKQKMSEEIGASELLYCYLGQEVDLLTEEEIEMAAKFAETNKIKPSLKIFLSPSHERNNDVELFLVQLLDRYDGIKINTIVGFEDVKADMLINIHRRLPYDVPLRIFKETVYLGKDAVLEMKGLSRYYKEEIINYANGKR